MDYRQFSNRVRQQFPQYKDYKDDEKLARAVIQKYPQYESVVQFPEAQRPQVRTTPAPRVDTPKQEETAIVAPSAPETVREGLTPFQTKEPRTQVERTPQPQVENVLGEEETIIRAPEPHERMKIDTSDQWDVNYMNYLNQTFGKGEYDRYPLREYFDITTRVAAFYAVAGPMGGALSLTKGAGASMLPVLKGLSPLAKLTGSAMTGYTVASIMAGGPEVTPQQRHQEGVKGATWFAAMNTAGMAISKVLPKIEHIKDKAVVRKEIEKHLRLEYNKDPKFLTPESSAAWAKHFSHKLINKPQETMTVLKDHMATVPESEGGGVVGIQKLIDIFRNIGVKLTGEPKAIVVTKEQAKRGMTGKNVKGIQEYIRRTTESRKFTPKQKKILIANQLTKFLSTAEPTAAEFKLIRQKYHVMAMAPENKAAVENIVNNVKPLIDPKSEYAITTSKGISHATGKEVLAKLNKLDDVPLTIGTGEIDLINWAIMRSVGQELIERTVAETLKGRQPAPPVEAPVPEAFPTEKSLQAPVYEQVDRYDTYYHVSPTDNRPSISERGFLPGGAGLAEKHPGQEFPTDFPGTYMHPEEQIAFRDQEQAGGKEVLDVYRIRVPEGEKAKIREDREGSPAYIDHIPREWIEVHEDGEWKPLEPPTPAEVAPDVPAAKTAEGHEPVRKEIEMLRAERGDVFPTKERKIGRLIDKYQIAVNRGLTEDPLVQQIESELKERGYELIDHTGEKYNDGMIDTTAINFKEDPSLPKGELRIIDSVAPTIYKDGKMFRAGKYLVAKGTAEVAPGPPDITEPTDPLAQEALKYDTAEEFVEGLKKESAGVFHPTFNVPMGKTQPIEYITHYEAFKSESPGESIFYSKPGGGHEGEFGDVKKDGFVDTNKLYKGNSSIEYMTEQNLLDRPMPKELQNLMGVDTLRDVENEWVEGVTENASEEYQQNPNLRWTAFQQMAKKELNQKGYKGAKWLGEDDLTPLQYQIWDESAIKPESELKQIHAEAHAEKPAVRPEPTTPVVRYSTPQTKETDRFRGGTWYATPESDMTDIKQDRTIAGETRFEEEIRTENPLIIDDADIRRGSANVIESGYEEFIPPKERKLANDLIEGIMNAVGETPSTPKGTKEMTRRVNKEITKALNAIGKRPEEITAVIASANSGDVATDLIIAEGLRKEGYDSLILKEGKDTHIFKLSPTTEEPVQVQETPEEVLRLEEARGAEFPQARENVVNLASRLYYAQEKGFRNHPRVEEIEKEFKDRGYEFADHVGEDYDPDVPGVYAVDFTEDITLLRGKQKIIDAITPAIYKDGRLYAQSPVVIGTGTAPPDIKPEEKELIARRAGDEIADSIVMKNPEMRSVMKFKQVGDKKLPYYKEIIPSGNPVLREIWKRHREGDDPIIVVGDLSGMKTFNDKYGRGVADAAVESALVEFAQNFSGNATVGSPSGDEMWGIMHKGATLEETRKHVTNLMRNLNNMNFQADGKVLGLNSKFYITHGVGAFEKADSELKMHPVTGEALPPGTLRINKDLVETKEDIVVTPEEGGLQSEAFIEKSEEDIARLERETPPQELPGDFRPPAREKTKITRIPEKKEAATQEEIKLYAEIERAEIAKTREAELTSNIVWQLRELANIPAIDPVPGGWYKLKEYNESIPDSLKYGKYRLLMPDSGSPSMDEAAEALNNARHLKPGDGISDDDLYQELLNYSPAPEVPTMKSAMEDAKQHFETEEGQEDLRQLRADGISASAIKSIIKERVRSKYLFQKENPIIQPAGNHRRLYNQPRYDKYNNEWVDEHMPLTYMGSKKQMQGAIQNALGLNEGLAKVYPRNLRKLDGITKVYDLFGGSGYLTVLAQELFPNAGQFLLNELSDEQQMIFRTVREDPVGLKQSLQLLSTYIHLPETPIKWAKEIHEELGPAFKEDTLKAAFTILKNNQKFGGRNTKKLSPIKLNKIYTAIDSYSERLSNADIYQRDAMEILEELKQLTKEEAEQTFVWIDPPYLWSTGYKIGTDFEKPEGFLELLDELFALNKKGVKFMFFNNEPLSRLHAVPDKIVAGKQINVIHEMLNTLAQEKNISVIREIDPIGAQARQEIIITNMPQANYKTEPIKKISKQTFADFMPPDDPIAEEQIKQKIAEQGEKIHNMVSKGQIRKMAAMASQAGLMDKNGQKGDRYRKFLKLHTGKRMTRELDKPEASKVIRAIENLQNNQNKLRKFKRDREASDKLILQQSKIITGKNHLRLMDNQEQNKFMTSLEMFDHTTDIRASAYVQYVGEALADWAQKNPEHVLLWKLWKTLESRHSDGRSWRLEVIQKFKNVFKGLSKKERVQVFEYMHRPKGTTHQEFLQQREEFGLNEKQKKVALQARELWNHLFRKSGLDPERYWTHYQPLIAKNNWSWNTAFEKYDSRDVPGDIKPFYTQERQGMLDSAVKDPLELFEIYTNAVVKSAYVQPAVADIQDYAPLTPPAMRKFLELFTRDELGYTSKVENAFDPLIEKRVNEAFSVIRKVTGLPAKEMADFLGFPTEGAMIKGYINFQRDIAYMVLGRPAATLKNTLQESHTIAEWGVKNWAKAKVFSKSTEGREGADMADIYTLGVAVKFDKGQGLVGAISQVIGTYFRAKDKGSRQTAYWAGRLAVRESLPMFDKGEITLQQLQERTNLTITDPMQARWARKFINKEKDAYEKENLMLFTTKVRRKIQALKNAKKHDEARQFAIEHIVGYAAQARTQYPYLKEQTEMIYRGLGKAVGVFGTWPPRFGVMVKRWIKGGKQGRKAILRYLLFWIALQQAGQRIGLDPKRWVGPQSFIRDPLVSSLNVVFGLPYRLITTGIYGVGRHLSGSRWDNLKYHQHKRELQRAAFGPPGTILREFGRAFTPGLSDSDRVKVIFGLPVDDETRDRIRATQRRSRTIEPPEFQPPDIQPPQVERR